MSRARAVVFRNGRARRAARVDDPRVRAALETRWDVTVLEPASAEEATALARHCTHDGTALVIAAGGDGTARAVAQGLVESAVPLGILPVGTANDLARALGLPRDTLAAARRLAAGAPRAVDVVDADGTIFCTVGGLGIVSRSALRVNALKAGGGVARAVATAAGSLIYKLTATTELLASGGRAADVTISLLSPQGVRRDLTLPLHGIFVANQRYLGGGLALPSGSRDDDGAFELCLVHRSPRLRLLDAFTRLTLGLPIPETVLSVIPAREAHVVCSEADELLGDGDRLASGRIFHLRARPGALRVIV